MTAHSKMTYYHHIIIGKMTYCATTYSLPAAEPHSSLKHTTSLPDGNGVDGSLPTRPRVSARDSYTHRTTCESPDCLEQRFLKGEPQIEVTPMPGIKDIDRLVEVI